MEIIIHARNAQLAEDFKGITTDKLQSLNRFSVTIQGIKVEVQHEANPRHGKSSHEVTLTTHGAGPFMRAEGKGRNDLAAFDDAVQALQLQIRRIHEKSKDYGRETLRGKEVLD
jgi:ribosomal subunit interface protein